MSKLLVAYTKLLGLQSELPNIARVDAYWVENYHALLNELAEELENEDILAFRVEQAAIRSTAIYRNGVQKSPGRMVCDRAALSARLTAVMSYLQMQSSGDDRKKIMGFHPPLG